MRTRGAPAAARISPEEFRWRFGWTTFIIGVLAGVFFLAYPQFDLLISQQFHTADGRFSGQQNAAVKIARWAFIILFFSSLGVALCGMMLAQRQKRWFGLSARRWMFLALCLVVGPGLVANLSLKDQLGRARPKHVVEFGGEKIFTPPLIVSRECRRGCSFVSGEASSIFAVFYAAAFAIPQWSILFVVLGTVGGLAAGAIRISQGAHFLSDVAFAGVFMALTVHALYELIFGQPRIRSAIATAWQFTRLRA